MRLSPRHAIEAFVGSGSQAMTPRRRACMKKPASSAWPNSKDGPKAMSMCFSARRLRPSRHHTLSGLLDWCLRRDQLPARRTSDRKPHPISVAGRKGCGNVVAVFRIGLHTIIEQDRIAALQANPERRGRFEGEELKIGAGAIGRQIDQDALVRLRDIAHADAGAIGFRYRDLAVRGKIGAM